MRSQFFCWCIRTQHGQTWQSVCEMHFCADEQGFHAGQGLLRKTARRIGILKAAKAD